MIRALLVCMILLAGCTSADGLNALQRDYLLKDARFALDQAAEVNATALLAGLLFGEGTVSPAASEETNVSRVVERATMMLDGCAGARVEGSSIGVSVFADCELNGVHFSLDSTVYILSVSSQPTVEVTLLTLGDSIGGVRLHTSDVTLRAGALPHLKVSAISYEWRTLEFEGSVAVDDLLSGATLSGAGRWLDRSLRDEALPVHFDAFALSPLTCGPEQGAMTIGPRQVLLAPDASAAFEQQIAPAAAIQQARIAFGATEQVVDATCPDSEF